jgi:hypothetical protein
MNRITLDEAHEKARWARQHYEALWPDIDAFHERDDHRITVSIDPDAGEYVFHVFDLPTPNPDWGLQIGDCLHNARAALDYLMVRLYALGTGQDPKDIEGIGFPVLSKLEKWDTNPTVKRFEKEPMLSGYLTRVQELQPFNDRNPSVWGRIPVGLPRTALLPVALSKLSEWDNIDKHRVIHATWLSGALSWGNPPAPKEFRYLGGFSSYDTLEEGAQIGWWRFQTPLPFVWEPTEVEMKRYFPIEVSLEQLFPPKGILTLLPLCLWGVTTVLEIFDPVFTRSEPPRPVTVSLPPL